MSVLRCWWQYHYGGDFRSVTNRSPTLLPQKLLPQINDLQHLSPISIKRTNVIHYSIGPKVGRLKGWPNIQILAILKQSIFRHCCDELGFEIAFPVLVAFSLHKLRKYSLVIFCCILRSQSLVFLYCFNLYELLD